MSDDTASVAESSWAERLPEMERELWYAWMPARSMVIRDKLIDFYLPSARLIAARLYRMRVDSSVQFDDYLQYARIGLIESVERFDPSRGAPFIAFGSHRIRGAILNGLARESELAAQREALRRLGRERRESLLVEAAGEIERASLSDLIELTVGLALGALLDEAGEVADDSAHANPYAATEVMQLQRLAWAAVEHLPTRERDLIVAHYGEQREFRELADAWSLSPGRVSQLHARAIKQLRQLLAAEPKINRRV